MQMHPIIIIITPTHSLPNSHWIFPGYITSVAMSSAPVYLDHNATTRPSASVRGAVAEAMENCWGNPSSNSEEGRKAR